MHWPVALRVTHCSICLLTCSHASLSTLSTVQYSAYLLACLLATLFRFMRASHKYSQPSASLQLRFLLSVMPHISHNQTHTHTKKKLVLFLTLPHIISLTVYRSLEFTPLIVLYCTVLYRNLTFFFLHHLFICSFLSRFVF